MEALFAVVGRPDIAPQSRHSVGYPAPISGSRPEPLAWPRVVIIELRIDGVFLVRYADDESFAGDTWHQSLEDAQLQAVSEYGQQVGDWSPIPLGVQDRIAFALARATE